MPCRDADVLVLPLDRRRVDDIPAERVRPPAAPRRRQAREPPTPTTRPRRVPRVVPSDARLDEVTITGAMKSPARQWPGLAKLLTCRLLAASAGRPLCS